MTIGTPYDQADYIIESDEGEIASGTTTANTFATFTLDTTLQVTQSEYMDRAKGIRVHATGSSSIYILVSMKIYNNEVSSYNTIQVYPNEVYPNDDEEYVYYAISPDTTPGVMNSYSNVLLVGNHDNTTVSIQPTQTVHLPEDAQPNSDFVEVGSNTTHTITLNSLQTLLLANVLDLSGTKMVSNKPLTIISGHQCAQVGDSSRCEPMYVHLLPTVNWGQEFLLPRGDVVSTDYNRYFKLVVQENSPSFNYSVACSYSSSTNYMETMSFQTRYYENCYLTASSPVFLVQVTISGNQEEFSIGDFTVISPTMSHVKNASFTSLPSELISNFVTVAVLREHFNRTDPEILLDGSSFDCNRWSSIYIYMYYTRTLIGYSCTSLVSSGPHTISHEADNGVLSVLVHGWNLEPRLSYSYLSSYNLGMEID